MKESKNKQLKIPKETFVDKLDGNMFVLILFIVLFLIFVFAIYLVAL